MRVDFTQAAVAQVAAKNDTPFVVLRTMSDNCDEDAREKLVVQQFDISDYCRTASTVTAAPMSFDGYTYAEGYNNGSNVEVKTGTVAGDGSLVLKLYYTPNDDQLTYNGNGATGGSTTATKGKVDQEVTVAENGFKRAGYTFTGWSTAAEGGTPYAANDAYKLTAGDDVLYAQRTPNQGTANKD